ncbi:MAG: PAS domain S-box protein [Chloroflexota bacterium]
MPDSNQYTGSESLPSDSDSLVAEDYTAFALAELQAQLQESRQLLELAQKREEIYHSIFEYSLDGQMLSTPEGRILDANPAATRILGYSRAEILALGRNKIMDLTDPRLAQFLEKRSREGYAIADLTCIRKDGVKIEVEVSSQLFCNSAGEARTSFIFRDVSERKQVEEALRESETRFQTFMHNSPTAAWITTDTGRVLYQNPAYTRMTGIRFEEATGKDAFDIYPKDVAEAYLATIRQAAETGQTIEVVEAYQLLDGTQGYAISYKFPLPDHNSEHLVGGMAIDITARERVEEALRESEERYRFLAEHATDVIFRDGPDGKLKYLSPACRTVLGYEPEELLGASYIQYVHPDDLAPMQKLSKAQVADPGSATTSFRYRCKDGHYTWIETNLKVITDPTTKQVLNIVGVMRDISERKRIEEALRRSEALYRMLVRNLPDSAILVFDLDLRCLVADGGVLTRYGLISEQLEGRAVQEVLQAQNALHFLPYYQAALAGLENTFEEYYADRVYLVRMVPVKDDRGEIVAGMMFSQDITSLKRAEQVLAAEKERLSVTLRSIGDGVITTGIDGRITLLNRVAETLTGWSQAEALERPLTEVFRLFGDATSPLQKDPTQDALKTGEVVTLRSPALLVARDGSERHIADSCAPIRAQKGQIIGLALVFRDITAQLRLEEELQKTAKLESLGVLAGGIAHDFNNLLAGILGYLDLIKLQLITEGLLEDEELEDFFKQAEAATLRAKDLTMQLLTFAKGGAPIKKTAHIHQIIEDSVNFVLHGTGVHPIFELPPELHPVEVDLGQLNQVIQNLALNAVQAMPEGGIFNISAQNLQLSEATLLPLQAGNYVLLTFWDQGGGIPPEILPKIFDPYFTTKRTGSGLGLAVCYSIVRQHDGHIAVESKVGKGTRFSIYLPALKQLPEKKSSPSKSVFDTTLPSLRVLVMDDELLLQKVLKRIFLKLGHEVVLASEGEQACQLYQAALEVGQPFDVVLIDLTIPGGLGGKQTMTRLLELDPEVTAVVCSGYSSDPIMSDYQKFGFKAVLTKPYLVEDLQRVLSQLMAL